jgi:hypothetical protein
MDIKTIKKKYEERLMQLPNVMGVGLGEKGGKRVIKVFVTRKIPESSLRSGEVIPDVLEGFEVDVEEMGEVRPES